MEYMFLGPKMSQAERFILGKITVVSDVLRRASPSAVTRSFFPSDLSDTNRIRKCSFLLMFSDNEANQTGGTGREG